MPSHVSQSKADPLHADQLEEAANLIALAVKFLRAAGSGAEGLREQAAALGDAMELALYQARSRAAPAAPNGTAPVDSTLLQEARDRAQAELARQAATAAARRYRR
jgi:hypothetical protein